MSETVEETEPPKKTTEEISQELSEKIGFSEENFTVDLKNNFQFLLNYILEDVFVKSDDILFKESKKGTNKEREECIDAARYLRINKEKSIHNFIEIYLKKLEVEKENLESAPIINTDLSGLSLQSSEDYELDLAAKNMNVKLNHKYAKLKKDLEGYLSFCVQKFKISLPNKILDVENFSAAFLKMLRTLELQFNTKLVLFKLFEEGLDENLPVYYQTLIFSIQKLPSMEEQTDLESGSVVSVEETINLDEKKFLDELLFTFLPDGGENKNEVDLTNPFAEGYIHNESSAISINNEEKNEQNKEVENDKSVAKQGKSNFFGETVKQNSQQNVLPEIDFNGDNNSSVEQSKTQSLINKLMNLRGSGRASNNLPSTPDGLQFQNQSGAEPNGEDNLEFAISNLFSSQKGQFNPHPNLLNFVSQAGQNRATGVGLKRQDLNYNLPISYKTISNSEQNDLPFVTKSPIDGGFINAAQNIYAHLTRNLLFGFQQSTKPRVQSEDGLSEILMPAYQNLISSSENILDHKIKELILKNNFAKSEEIKDNSKNILNQMFLLQDVLKNIPKQKTASQEQNGIFDSYKTFFLIEASKQSDIFNQNNLFKTAFENFIEAVLEINNLENEFEISTNQVKKAEIKEEIKKKWDLLESSLMEIKKKIFGEIEEEEKDLKTLTDEVDEKKNKKFEGEQKTHFISKLNKMIKENVYEIIDASNLLPEANGFMRTFIEKFFAVKLVFVSLHYGIDSKEYENILNVFKNICRILSTTDVPYNIDEELSFEIISATLPKVMKSVGFHVDKVEPWLKEIEIHYLEKEKYILEKEKTAEKLFIESVFDKISESNEPESQSELIEMKDVEVEAELIIQEVQKPELELDLELYTPENMSESKVNAIEIKPDLNFELEMVDLESEGVEVDKLDEKINLKEHHENEDRDISNSIFENAEPIIIEVLSEPEQIDAPAGLEVSENTSQEAFDEFEKHFKEYSKTNSFNIKDFPVDIKGDDIFGMPKIEEIIIEEKTAVIDEKIDFDLEQAFNVPNDKELKNIDDALFVEIAAEEINLDISNSQVIDILEIPINKGLNSKEFDDITKALSIEGDDEDVESNNLLQQELLNVEIPGLNDEEVDTSQISNMVEKEHQENIQQSPDFSNRQTVDLRYINPNVKLTNQEKSFFEKALDEVFKHRSENKKVAPNINISIETTVLSYIEMQCKNAKYIRNPKFYHNNKHINNIYNYIVQVGEFYNLITFYDDREDAEILPSKLMSIDMFNKQLIFRIIETKEIRRISMPNLLGMIVDQTCVPSYPDDKYEPYLNTLKTCYGFSEKLGYIL